jgi:hypothetical protein
MERMGEPTSFAWLFLDDYWMINWKCLNIIIIIRRRRIIIINTTVIG